jgi:hypothetical protein
LRYTSGVAVPADAVAGSVLADGQTLWADSRSPRRFQRRIAGGTASPLLAGEFPARILCAFLGAEDLVTLAKTCQRCHEEVLGSGAWLEAWDASAISGAVIVRADGTCAVGPSASLLYHENLRCKLLQIAAVCRGDHRLLASTVLRHPTAATSLDGLRRGHLIDAQDTARTWFPAVVLDTRVDGAILVSYWGWTARWDEWIERTAFASRVALRGERFTHWFVPRADASVYAMEVDLPLDSGSAGAMLQQTVLADMGMPQFRVPATNFGFWPRDAVKAAFASTLLDTAVLVARDVPTVLVGMQQEIPCVSGVALRYCYDIVAFARTALVGTFSGCMRSTYSDGHLKWNMFAEATAACPATPAMLAFSQAAVGAATTTPPVGADPFRAAVARHTRRPVDRRRSAVPGPFSCVSSVTAHVPPTSPPPVHGNSVVRAAAPVSAPTPGTLTVTVKGMPWLASAELSLKVDANLLIRDLVVSLQQRSSDSVRCLRYGFGTIVAADAVAGSVLADGQTLWADSRAPCRFQRRIASGTASPLLAGEFPARILCAFLDARDLVALAGTCQRCHEEVLGSGAWLEAWDASAISGAVIVRADGTCAVGPSASLLYHENLRCKLLQIAAVCRGDHRLLASTALRHPTAATTLDGLRRGHLIDVQDTVNDWYPAVVLDTRDTGAILVSYWGWTARWDEWIEPDAFASRVALRGEGYTHWFVPRADATVYAIETAPPATAPVVASLPARLYQSIFGEAITARAAAPDRFEAMKRAALIDAGVPFLLTASNPNVEEGPFAEGFNPLSNTASSVLFDAKTLIAEKLRFRQAPRLQLVYETNHFTSCPGGAPVLRHRYTVVRVGGAMLVGLWSGWMRATYFDSSLSWRSFSDLTRSFQAPPSVLAHSPAAGIKARDADATLTEGDDDGRVPTPPAVTRCGNFSAPFAIGHTS